MPGLRIKHSSVREAVIVIPVPPKGPRGVTKNLRVEVDSEGYALVSEGVWDEIVLASTIGNEAGFIFVNEVPNPPTLVVQAGAGEVVMHDTDRRSYLVEQQALREIAPVGVTTRVVEHGLPPSV